MALQSGQLTPHDPSIPFLNKVPVKFDANAKCTLIDEKMHEWLESEDHVSAMYEFIGYCLWREYTYQNAFFFVGEGENGKTTLLKLITAFLGSDNVSNIPIQDLSDEFKTVNLFGKLANIADELSSKSLEDTSKFKQLTGESPMSGSRKYVQDPTQFISYAKQLYATNELPRTSDKSHAFFRRPIIFKFIKTFTNDNGNKDPNLLKKLTTSEELSGLLNKAIEGLKRLQERKVFSVQPSSTDTEELWTTDTVQEFVFNCLENSSKNACLAFTEIYKTYEQYCQNKSVQILEPNSFALKLKNHIQFQRTRKMVNNVRQYYYFGIQFKGSLETQNGLLISN
jgi:putative DNA primase/helicase